MHFYIQLCPSVRPSGIRWLAFSRFTDKRDGSLYQHLPFIQSCLSIDFTHCQTLAYRILFGIKYYRKYRLLFPYLQPSCTIHQIYKVVYQFILHIVRAWPTECHSVFGTTEYTISYFPFHSQTVHLIIFFLYSKLFSIDFTHCQSRAYLNAILYSVLPKSTK